jgi:hypothetical protein
LTFLPKKLRFSHAAPSNVAIVTNDDDDDDDDNYNNNNNSNRNSKGDHTQLFITRKRKNPKYLPVRVFHFK